MLLSLAVIFVKHVYPKQRTFRKVRSEEFVGIGARGISAVFLVKSFSDALLVFINLAVTDMIL